MWEGMGGSPFRRRSLPINNVFERRNITVIATRESDTKSPLDGGGGV